MSDFSCRPDGFSEIDRPKLGDAISDAEGVLAHWKKMNDYRADISPRERVLAVALEDLINSAVEAELTLKEFI